MQIEISGISYPLHLFNTIIVGSGAAGFNAAVQLVKHGQSDIALLTEGINMGTSRNTGSDKQTYYKLSTTGDTPDSIGEMANRYFSGGAMHGDLALSEAANSLSCFYHLIEQGLPFPKNEFGEYVGYRTDHDNTSRATSCGPLTSKLMTEALEAEVRAKNIPIFDGFRVVTVIRDQEKALGLLAIDKLKQTQPDFGLTLFCCTNIIWATGGPAGIYAAAVYPESQTCAHGAAFAAGVKGVNLTEWQFGLSSVKFRWNVSGSYQQVIPRYFSIGEDGGYEKDFLSGTIPNPTGQLNAIFRKGYEWPFDAKKLNGSSAIDAAVFTERAKGRRVFLDFTRSPFNLGLLGAEAKDYLTRSGAITGTPVTADTPIERLKKLNPKAIELYQSHGIDLEHEPLEIDLCAQHNNGGLLIDTNSETNLPHFFAAGEAAGVFGVYRPGGAALNSTQVTSLRAAQYISQHYRELPESELFIKQGETSVTALNETIRHLTANSGKDLFSLRKRYQERMTRFASVLRNPDAFEFALEACRNDLIKFEKVTAAAPGQITDALINRDILQTQFAYLSAMQQYAKQGGVSRGSALYAASFEPAGPSQIPESDPKYAYVGELTCDLEKLTAEHHFVPVRPIPNRELWFEKVYNQNNDH
ncbi:MAG TPA: FAD-binding protein [Oscillospiraceae bacterium]|nr:FAD-binding protein [Oscillospiraceae bacterium]HPF54954.1 FAD-binding protein [Clostridiales bacterium]HPK34367.1 FAD-binding protein [Oscillospiraceae bacterium]HPR75813.1 FAD-binding protein [Oscillospiraceae bacterium]